MIVEYAVGCCVQLVASTWFGGCMYTNLHGNIIFIAYYIVHGVVYMKTNRDA